MRTLLKRLSNGLYFKGPDEWTNSAADAHDFRMIDRALDFIQRWHLNDVEVVFSFRGREEVKRVPPDKISLRYTE